MNNMEIIYYETIYVSEVIDISPNKAGLFEGSFSWGWGQYSYFKKNLFNINITLYNC